MVRAVLGVSACVVLIAVAGCGGESGSTTRTPADRADGAAHKWFDRNPCQHPHTYNLSARFEKIEPARIDPDATSGYQGVVIGQVRNAWVAGDHENTTTVLAGGGGYGRENDGELMIVRDGLQPRVRRLYVHGAGLVRITRAPLGCRVVTWAQKRGNINFKGQHGITGTLHLKDDTLVAGVPKDLVRIPSLMDEPLPAARADLSDHDLRWKIVGQGLAVYGGESPPLILGTNPPGGDRVHTGTTVSLYLKEGKQG